MVKSSAKPQAGTAGTTLQSEQIDEMISELGDWRGKTLSKVRQLINEADPEVVEELKW